MNTIVVSGKIASDILEDLNGELYCSKFKIKNMSYSPNRKYNNVETVMLPCIAYGNVARYVSTELYNGCDVLITGRILTRTYKVESNKTVTKYYIGCNTVTKLEQELYE